MGISWVHTWFTQRIVCTIVLSIKKGRQYQHPQLTVGVPALWKQKIAFSQFVLLAMGGLGSGGKARGEKKSQRSIKN